LHASTQNVNAAKMARKTKEMSPDKKRQVVRLHQDGFEKNRNGKDNWI